VTGVPQYWNEIKQVSAARGPRPASTLFVEIICRFANKTSH